MREDRPVSSPGAGAKLAHSGAVRRGSSKIGVARNDDLDVKAPVLRIGGAGDIDIGNSRLNYVAKATVVATSKGQGGADLDHLAGLTIPVKLTGPFDAPKYEIDYGAVASQAAKARAQEKVQERLKDLLRRR